MVLPLTLLSAPRVGYTELLQGKSLPSDLMEAFTVVTSGPAEFPSHPRLTLYSKHIARSQFSCGIINSTSIFLGHFLLRIQGDGEAGRMSSLST